ncbi:MAG: hypothetical protein KAQ85_02315 [Thermodesulfovibrionia bacterium]|nr:hypothetical protein [Thermodesulfovibrionia bacterium]
MNNTKEVSAVEIEVRVIIDGDIAGAVLKKGVPEYCVEDVTLGLLNRMSKMLLDMGEKLDAEEAAKEESASASESRIISPNSLEGRLT